MLCIKSSIYFTGQALGWNMSAFQASNTTLNHYTNPSNLFYYKISIDFLNNLHFFIHHRKNTNLPITCKPLKRIPIWANPSNLWLKQTSEKKQNANRRERRKAQVSSLAPAIELAISSRENSWILSTKFLHSHTPHLD